MKKYFCELVRHGHGSNERLSGQGVLQVKAVLPKLKCPELIVVSPAKRAKETSELILEYFKNLRHTPKLEVIKDFGEVKINSKTAADIKYHHKPWGDLWIEGHAGFEPIASYLERIKKAFRAVPHNKNVLIVGHEETVWAYMCLEKNISMDKAIKTDIPFASIHKITLPLDSKT